MLQGVPQGAQFFFIAPQSVALLVYVAPNNYARSRSEQGYIGFIAIIFFSVLLNVIQESVKEYRDKIIGHAFWSRGNCENLSFLEKFTP